MTDPTLRPRRSVLYLPASSARMLEKARSLPCDGLILDLEDAVAPEDKALARRQAADAIAAGAFGPREVIVRINAEDSPWFEGDVEALAGVPADGVALPKVAGTDDLARLGERLPGEVRLWALIETAAALLDLAAIAAAPRLAGLVVGVNDLVRETRIRPGPGRDRLRPLLTQVVVAARAHGLAALDGVFNDLADPEGLAAECAAGRDMGFDGKTLVHPGQIAAANRAFAPDAAELADARAIVAAFDDPANAGRAVLRLGGRMVERLHLEAARRLIALDAAIRQRLDSAGAGEG